MDLATAKQDLALNVDSPTRLRTLASSAIEHGESLLTIAALLTAIKLDGIEQCLDAMLEIERQK